MDQGIDGIILRCTPLRDVSCVCAAYTKERGLVSFVTPKSKAARAQIQPYARLELVLRAPKSGELFCLLDYSIHNAYLALRATLPRLRTAALCAGALLQSQMPAKPSERLFAAFCRHLEAIAQSREPGRIGAQFLIKLLKHEGLLEAPAVCTECNHALGPATPTRFGMLCSSCAPPSHISLSVEEYGELTELFESRKVLEGATSSFFSEKLQKIFTQKMHG